MIGDELLERISVDPRILSGKPVIRRMRISVDLIIGLLAQGVSEAEILQDYPDLEPEDIRAALAYAYRRLLDEEVHPLAANGRSA